MFTRVFDFFLYYVPYRAFVYYRTSPTPKFSAFILLLFIISSNVFSIFLILNHVLNWEYSILSENRVTNRFVVIPLMLSPFIVLIMLFYTLNRNRVRERVIFFENLAVRDKSRLNMFFWLYIVGSIILFLLAITSPVWLN
jgi:hypothetical protein